MLAWLKNLFWMEPLPVVTTDPDVPFEETVPVQIVCDEHLERVPARTSAGYHHWWIIDLRSNRFVRVTLPRGDAPLDVGLRLRPGRYLVGTGRGRRSIRRRIAVGVPAPAAAVSCGPT